MLACDVGLGLVKRGEVLGMWVPYVFHHGSVWDKSASRSVRLTPVKWSQWILRWAWSQSGLWDCICSQTVTWLGFHRCAVRVDLCHSFVLPQLVALPVTAGGAVLMFAARHCGTVTVLHCWLCWGIEHERFVADCCALVRFSSVQFLAPASSVLNIPLGYAQHFQFYITCWVV
jgi:hypothetical protein